MRLALHRHATRRWPRVAPHALCAAVICGSMMSLVAPALGTVVTAVGVCAAGVSAVVAIRRELVGPALVALATALFVGAWGWGEARIASTAPPRVATAGAVAGVFDVETTPQRTGRGYRVRVRVAQPVPALGLDVGVRLIADLPDRVAPMVRIGARLRLGGRLAPAAAPDSPAWWSRYLVRQRISGRLVVRTAVAHGRRGGLAGMHDRLRAWALTSVGAGTDGERRAVLKGMALGGGGGLSEETADEFRDAGIWHLLAVSGQNVTMIVVALTALLGALGIPRLGSVVVSVAVVVTYCLLCDGGASVGRAGIMAGLGLVAWLRSRASDRWYLLLAGLAALTIHQPRAIGDPGLQLSFAAVVGLLLVAGPVQRWLEGALPQRMAAVAAAGIGATLATAPVVVWHFGELSLAGLVVNLVAVPIASVVVVLAMTGLVMGAAVPAAGAVLGWVAGLGAEALLVVAHAAASLPGASITLPRWAAGVALVVAVGGVLLVRHAWKATAPPVSRVPPRTAWLALTGALIAVIALLIPSPTPAQAWPNAVAVSALDIGQGDAILLRSPDGTAVLIDTGPTGEPAAVVAALHRAGVARLDVLAITHNQADHAGAAAAIMEDFDVARLLVPVSVPDAEAAAKRAGVPIVRVGAGDRIDAGQWRLDVLWPRRGDPPPEDPNDGCLVVAAEGPGLRVLLTGDAEGNVLSRLRLPRIDVLKVAHHGSEDPQLEGVVRRLRPAVALISVGRRNRFGHPRPDTLATLAAARVDVRRTDQAGSATVVGGAAGLTIATER